MTSFGSSSQCSILVCRRSPIFIYLFSIRRSATQIISLSPPVLRLVGSLRQSFSCRRPGPDFTARFLQLVFFGPPADPTS
jgi:hypothetical protein